MTNKRTNQLNKRMVCVHLCMRIRHVDRFLFLFHSWFIIIEIGVLPFENGAMRWPMVDRFSSTSTSSILRIEEFQRNDNCFIHSFVSICLISHGLCVVFRCALWRRRLIAAFLIASSVSYFSFSCSFSLNCSLSWLTPPTPTDDDDSFYAYYYYYLISTHEISQKLWKNKIEWDEPIMTKTKRKWTIEA